MLDTYLPICRLYTPTQFLLWGRISLPLLIRFEGNVPCGWQQARQYSLHQIIWSNVTGSCNAGPCNIVTSKSSDIDDGCRNLNSHFSYLGCSSSRVFYRISLKFLSCMFMDNGGTLLYIPDITTYILMNLSL